MYYDSSDTNFSQFAPMYLPKNIENAAVQALTQLIHYLVNIRLYNKNTYKNYKFLQKLHFFDFAQPAL